MSGAGENNKLLILAGGRRNFGSANKLRESLLGNGRESLIVTDLCLKNYEAPHVRTIKYYRDLFNIKYEESRKDCHDFINLAEELKIDERSTFKDLVTYKGVSLWKMSATYLLFELSPLLEDYRLSCEIVNFEKPGEIIILDDSGKLGNIFRAICLNRGVPLKTVKTGISLQPVKKYVSYLEYFLRKAWRFCKSLYSRWLNFINSAGKKASPNPLVIFFNNLDRKLDSLLPLILRYRPDERLVINMPYCGSEKKLKAESISYREFYGYLLYSVFDRKINAFLKNIWEEINKSQSFKSGLNYRGDTLWPLLKDAFFYVIFREFPEQIRNTELVRKIILSHKTKCVAVADYNCEVVLPARSLSIPTVAIPTNISEDFKFYGGVISDYVFAPGKRSRDDLLKLGAKPEQVFVVGHPKSDLFFNRKFEKEDIFKELGLDERLKTVLYVGTYPGCGLYYQDYIPQIHMIYKGLSRIKNVNLVTKLHPYVTDFNLYKRIADEECCGNMLVIRDYDIWKLLYMSDLVISDHSTVSYEAVIMDKNVILYCYANKYFDRDIWNFAESQAALFIEGFSDLEKKVNEALDDEALQIRLRENRRKYIMEYAWPLDGRAAYRIKDLIGRLAVYAAEKNSGR